MMKKATEAMANVYGKHVHFGSEHALTSEKQKEIIDDLEKESESKLHTFTKHVAAVGAGFAVETGVMNATFAFGNGVSQALTGENLHGAGLVATAGVATVLGIGSGIRTAYAVEDGFDMVDTWRMQNAKHSLQVLEDVESRATSEEDDVE